MNTTTPSLTNTMATGSKLQAVILAGGKGKRMFPFSALWKKCLLPIQNEPNLHRIVRQLHNLDITDITVVYDDEEKKMKRSVRDYSNVKFQIIKGSISDTLRELTQTATEALIHYGDVYVSDADMAKLLAFPANSMLVEPKNANYNVSEHIGVMVEDKRVVKLYPHPRKHYANGRSCGVFKVNQTILSELEYYEQGAFHLNTGAMPDDSFLFEELINQADTTMTAVNVDGVYVDLNLPWDLLEVNRRSCAADLSALTQSIHETANIAETARLEGNVVIGKNSHIGHHVLIEGNCIIGDNVTIDNGAIIGKHCVIGNGSRIVDYCRVNECTVIGPENKIGYNAEVSGVTFKGVAAVHGCEVFGLIGSYVDIAAGVQMAIMKFDDSQASQAQMGRRYANDYTNAIFLGDFVRTGIGNLFYPGVKVGSRSCLGPGLVVNRDVAANKVILLKQEWIEKDWGSNKYGW